MPRRAQKSPKQVGHHWYLAEWAKMMGKTQADAQRDMGWSKATASDLFTGRQRYNQDYIEQASKWLNIRPYEMLMSVEHANGLRKMVANATRIVEEASTLDEIAATERADKVA